MQVSEGNTQQSVKHGTLFPHRLSSSLSVSGGENTSGEPAAPIPPNLMDLTLLWRLCDLISLRSGEASEAALAVAHRAQLWPN